MPAEFTPREVAELSGGSKSAVEKAIEEKILAPSRSRRFGRSRRVLPGHAVAYTKVMCSLKVRLDLGVKRRFAARLIDLNSADVRTFRFELEPAVELDVGRLVGDTLERAERYGAARDRLIVEDDAILGGTPVIVGTRIGVHAVLGRIRDGDTIQDLVADYPDVPAEAFEAAIIYARSHPLVGRPAGRPWAKAG